MIRWKYLSYPISENTPMYGGSKSFENEQVKSLLRGDSCNSSLWRIPNHAGTHVDFPRHFDPDGLGANDYPPRFWLFASCFLANIEPTEPCSLIDSKRFDFSEIPAHTEFLLIRTGFFRLRRSDAYWKANPGLSPDMADVLRERLPRLRMIGVDFISISSFSKRQAGRKAHRSFLRHSRPILLVEDMDLSCVDDSTRFEEIFVFPLIVEGADASPCTVVSKEIQ
jgi:kynurenine formamidase